MNHADKQQDNSTKRGKKVPGRPFPKGKSGNPKGRPPKGESLTEVLKETLGEEGKATAAQKLIDLAFGKGKRKPYFPALKYLFDRTDGEPIKAIAATVEMAELPVVRIREKEAGEEEEISGDEGRE
ncbi:MAG: hypothetical protein LBU28_07040 [Spirochaetaceae bacterium]|jgi:hypothetical protein|nr:hypothetical protein [Spirochaetaceae bacterium]